MNEPQTSTFPLSFTIRMHIGDLSYASQMYSRDSLSSKWKKLMGGKSDREQSVCLWLFSAIGDKDGSLSFGTEALSLKP